MNDVKYAILEFMWGDDSMKGSRKESLNLLVTLDQNYLEPLKVMLQSYGALHRDVKTELYVAHSSLHEEDFTSLEKAVCGLNITIHNKKITERYFKDIPVLARIPEESFYRLLAFLYLPEHVERCLYLDPDTYILKRLVPLYETDFGDAYIAAAAHLHGFHNALNKVRLGLKDQKRYLNSGVVLMNLKAIRQDFTLENILECLENNAQRLILGDQDLLNLLFGSKTLFLEERIYNLDERAFQYYKKHESFDLSAVKEKTAIVHYNGKYKPWLEGYKGALDVLYPPVETKGPAPKGMIKKQVESVLRITRLTPQQTVVLVGAVCLLGAWIITYFFAGKKLAQILADPALFRSWLNQFGLFDEVCFILIRAAQTVFKFIPAEPLEIGSGYAWGAFFGMVYCILGNMIGTLAVFSLTKRFGQKVLTFFVPANNRKNLAVWKNSQNTYALFFLIYLIPGTPKDGLTYIAGFMGLKPIPYMIMTAVARIPSVLSSTLCGATLAEEQYLTSLLIFVLTGLLAAVGAVIYRSFTKKQTAAE